MNGRSTERGLTLVEVSVAVLVVAIGLISVLAVFPVGLRWAADARNHSIAPHAAQTVAEYYLKDSIAGGSGGAVAKYNASLDPPVSFAADTSTLGTTDDYYFQITRVAWQARGHSMTLIAYRKKSHVGTATKSVGSYCFRLYDNAD